jgi:hypothetical protein
MSQQSELPEAIAIKAMTTKIADTTKVNARIGSETLDFSIPRIVDAAAWKQKVFSTIIRQAE